MIRIVFFGTDELAIPVLASLLSDTSLHIVAVVTKPAAPSGRGLKLQEPPIVAHVPKEIPILQPTKLDAAFLAQLQSCAPDIAVVAVYGKIIPRGVLHTPRYGTINVHPSLLPLYRGPSPIVSAILAGDAQTGVSIMHLDEEMDHGPVYAQEIVAIDPVDTKDTLTHKLAQIAGPLLTRTIHGIVEECLQPTEQDHARATVTRKFTAADYALDFTQPAIRVLRTIHAFPGEAWFMLPSGRRCKVFAASIANDHHEISPPGSLLCEKKRCYVACTDAALCLEDVLPEGRKRMTGESFAQGYRSAQ